MSDFTFSVEMDASKISGPADQARARIDKMNASAKESKKALDYSDKAKRAADELTRIRMDPKGFLAARDTAKQLREEQQRLIKQHEGGVKGLFKWVTPYGLGRLGSNILGNLGSDAVEKIGSTLVDGARAAVDIIKEGISKAFEVGGREEHLRGSFKYLFGGTEQAKAAIEEAERFSKSLPFGGQKTVGYLGELGKAGIKGQAAAASLALAADVGGMSPTGEGTDEALYALERLKRHGEFSPRLAEGLNINLNDFYAAIGKKLNVSAVEARKQLGDPGKIGFNTILNTLMEIHSRAIGAPTGSVALEQSKELMQRWARIKELPEEYLRSISSSPGWSHLSDTLGRVLDQLNPQKHPEIVQALIDGFDTLARKAEGVLTPDNVKKFTDALSDIPGELKTIADGFTSVLGVATDFFNLIRGANREGEHSRWQAATHIYGAASSAATNIQSELPQFGYARNFDERTEEAKQQGASWWDQLKAGFGIEYRNPGSASAAMPSVSTSVPAMPSRPGVPSISGGGISINVPKIEVNVAAQKDDVNHTGQQVGVEVHREATKAFERAAQEAGASS